MKVLHVIPSLAPARGGPSLAIRFFERALAERGVGVETATTDDDGDGQRRRMPPNVHEDGTLRHYFRKNINFYSIAASFRPWIAEKIADFDLVHVHALFSHVSIEAALAARKRGVPYVIRPCGALTRYGMKTKPLLKALSVAMFEKRILRDAAGVHFTSEQEAEEAAALGIPMRPFVLPLGIEHPGDGDRARFLAQWQEAADGRVRLLFLSRIQEKKNLEALIDALALVGGGEDGPVLFVCGSGARDYEAALRARCVERGVADRVIWTGFLEGADKADAFSAADIFVLPSRSENFGIAVVEALLAGLPCIVGEGVGISDQVTAAGAGITTPPTAEGVAQAIRCMMKPGERDAMALRASEYAEQSFSVNAMGEKLCAIYDSILSGRAASS